MYRAPHDAWQPRHARQARPSAQGAAASRVSAGGCPPASGFSLRVGVWDVRFGDWGLGLGVGVEGLGFRA